VAFGVLVVQHGDKERVAGDPGLTDLGRAQARATAQRLGEGEAPIGIWTSPLRRALETATVIAQELGAPVTTDVRLRERLNWDDPSAQEEFVEDWTRTSADRTYVPRTGDSSSRAADRFLDALNDLAHLHRSGTAIVVAHGGVTCDALRTCLGDDVVRSRAPGLIDDGVPNCAITTFEMTDDGWTVASIAATDHLRT
jgi:broad specificity phosphatase PhoE